MADAEDGGDNPDQITIRVKDQVSQAMLVSKWARGVILILPDKDERMKALFLLLIAFTNLLIRFDR